MDRASLKYLSKDDLIEVITSDRMLERKALRKVISIVTEKVLSIIEEQEKCDLTTVDGKIKYFELEKEYQKWSGIQERL